MKTFMITLLLIGLSFSSYSQDEPMENDENGKVNIEELPAVVIKRIGKDFSVYIPDNHPDMNVTELQKMFIAYSLGKDFKGSETYLLIMESDTRNLTATYDERGKLIRVIENYHNIKMPRQVLYSIYKKYPEWTIIKDKYTYTQENGDVLKKEYKVRIKKGNEIKKLTVTDKGVILKDR